MEIQTVLFRRKKQRGQDPQLRGGSRARRRVQLQCGGYEGAEVRAGRSCYWQPRVRSR